MKRKNNICTNYITTKKCWLNGIFRSGYVIKLTSHIICVTNLVSDKYFHDWLLTEFNKCQIRQMQRSMDLAWYIINTDSKWPRQPIRIDNFKKKFGHRYGGITYNFIWLSTEILLVWLQKVTTSQISFDSL